MSDMNNFQLITLCRNIPLQCLHSGLVSKHTVIVPLWVQWFSQNPSVFHDYKQHCHK